MESVIQTIEERIKKQFMNEGTGHDWYHIDRVRKMAMHIQKREGGNPFVIELAALLHDVSDHKFNGGDFEKGGIVAREWLTKLKVDEEIIQAVTEIVNNISFKGSGEKDVLETLEGKIVQDADRLDAIGAIGIARTFAYGGKVDQPIYDPTVPPKKNQNKESYVSERSHTINHFYEKLLLIENRMNTPTGKLLAKERTDYMKGFLFQFYKEWNAVEQTTIHEKKP
ncbi:MAG TPA: HD domain-containing protein [Brumimicrobium sp.]|nr:HD domain-containing protein [Brumimicrobium sp.]